jgi:hypothetical protein
MDFYEFIKEYKEYGFIWLCGTAVKTLAEPMPGVKKFLKNLLTTLFLVFILEYSLHNSHKKEDLIVACALFVLIGNNVVALILNLGTYFQEHPKEVVAWLLRFFRK